MRTTLAIVLLLAACKQGGSADATPDAKVADAKKAAPAKAGKAGPPQAHGGGMPPGANPHGGGNPHAGMGGMGGGGPHAKATPPGPPRDVKPSGEVRTEKLAELSIDVPKEWESQPPASRMRLAQFAIPGPGGDATLAVFRFPGGGGAAQANIDRWVAQFSQPDGSDSKAKAKTENREVGKLKLTTLDLSGTFKGSAMPGAPAVPAMENARLLAGIIEGQGDAFFLKMTGSAKTVDLWAEGWGKALESVRPATADATAAKK